MRENWKFRILAIVLAVLTWHLVSGRETVESWVQVPVEMANLPKETLIRDGMVNRIEVRIRGPRGLVRGINDKGHVYTMDLKDLNVGINTIVFDPDNLTMGHALDVVEINPPRIDLVVDKVARKQMALEVQWQGDIDPDYELVGTSTEPERVEVKGPSAKLLQLEVLQTQPVSIANPRPLKVSEPVGVIVPPETEVTPTKVQAQLEFAPKLESIWVKKTVQLPDGAQVKVNPREVRLLLNLPVYLMRQDDWRDSIQVQVPVPSGLQPGDHELALNVKLPRFGVLLDSKPSNVTVSVPGQTNATSAGDQETAQ